jgi:gamma-glutamyltranspeptidase/glutathione hydrolase
LKDLSEYKVIWTNPIYGKYKEYDLFVNGEPDVGGAQLIEALNIAEEIKLSEIGHYSKSPVALATIYQILAATLYSSNLPSYYGDSIELNTDSRIKKETSKRVWEIWKAKNNLKAIFSKRNKNEHTAAIVAIDKYGNVVALIHTISVPNWGSGGLFVDGISIPDPANQRQQLIEKTGPGKRMPGETVPLLVFKNGKPVYGSACISGGAHNQTFVSLLNVFDFNLSPQESVEMPGIGEFSFIENELSLSVEPNKFQDSLLIKARGKRAYLNESPSIMSVFWTGIHINEKSGELHGTKVWLK